MGTVAGSHKVQQAANKFSDEMLLAVDKDASAVSFLPGSEWYFPLCHVRHFSRFLSAK